MCLVRSNPKYIYEKFRHSLNGEFFLNAAFAKMIKTKRKSLIEI